MLYVFEDNQIIIDKCCPDHICEYMLMCIYIYLYYIYICLYIYLQYINI